MGRGRQKAKQQKIARKLKYLTTDTDYDELAKELKVQDPGFGDKDTFNQEKADFSRGKTGASNGFASGGTSSTAANKDGHTAKTSPEDDDLDEYAKWAAEAAVKATGQISAVKNNAKPHKPIPMPVPGALRKRDGNKH